MAMTEFLAMAAEVPAATGVAEGTRLTTRKVLLYAALAIPAVAALVYALTGSGSWEKQAKGAAHLVLLYLLFAAYAL